MNISLTAIKEQLKTSQRIVIVTHTNPDGDAIGSSLGLYHFLYTLRIHQVAVITPTPYPVYLQFMPANEKVNIYTHNTPRCQKLVAEATLLFVLDCNAASRLDDLGKHIVSADCTKILIDHHLSPELPTNFQVWDTSASSTAELVYDFIQMIRPQSRLTEAAVLCLYTGIATDTGRFKYATNAKTLQTVAHLLEDGLDITTANNLIFDNNTENRLRLLGFILSQRMVVLPEYNVAYVYVTLADLLAFNYQTGDLEGVVNYPLSIDGINMVALFKEQTDTIRISMRSKGNFSVNDLARKHFYGGGHRNAAGGKFDQNLDQTIAYFCSILENYKEELAS